jgi:pilus assembly protein CpaB
MALLISGAFTWMAAKKLARPQTLNIAETMYVAPSRPIGPGETLSLENTELIGWPATHPVEGGFGQVAEAIGREALFPLAKGQPILDRDVAAAGAGGGLASRIPDGMRGVALRSDEIVGVGGFLLPGSHVDVLVTYRDAGAPEPLTATVLQDAVVIAAGHQTEPDPAGKAANANVVTLLLRPEEAQRAVLASTQGAVHFVLRNGNDASRVEAVPVGMSQLAGRPNAGARAASGNAPVAATANAARRGIETVLSGGGAGQ